MKKEITLETTTPRLIEDYIPIEVISAEASSEPRVKGHISTMHIWRARRPLVACRAAVYGALVPVDQFRPNTGPDNKRDSLARANAAKFVESLCNYPGNPSTIAQARQHILDAHAERLTHEIGKKVTADDIIAGLHPRPRVLDLFAGGGAIPLEASRLGCETHSIDLNPVAHIIELCGTTFPQKFGVGLTQDIEFWGRQILDRTQSAVSDLYYQLANPNSHGELEQATQAGLFGEQHVNAYTLSVVANYWTRTVPCQNPSCGGTVPLYHQTWLRKKDTGYVALKPLKDLKRKVIRFQVVTTDKVESLDFDPGQGIEGTSTVCPFCQSAVSAEYVRSYGSTQGFGQQLMCVIALNPEGTGKLYIIDDELIGGEEARQALAAERELLLEQELGWSSLDEEIPPTGNAGLSSGKSYLYGIRTFRQAFTPRQRCVLLTFAKEIRAAHAQMLESGLDEDRAKSITTYLGLWLSRLTDRFNTLARWDNSGEKIQGLTSLKRIAMTWDYPELNIFGGASGDAWGNLKYITAVIDQEGTGNNPVQCFRGSATELTYPAEYFDAVITDPPYYDNESYSELSDVSYVWMRFAIGYLYPEHFSSSLTPKKKECVAAAYRQGGTKQAAYQAYEDCLFLALQQANRVMKPTGILVLVYAHKTTAGWGTLVDAIRRAGFEVAEAWPLDTESKARVAHQGDAALASSIFLVARKRTLLNTGSYEDQVQPELEHIVRERIETLWDMGISGADLVIAGVGAGLRAFTRYARVEYANGEEVPADQFLTEVEGVVLESLLEKIFSASRAGLAVVDGASRFYVLWRYAYRAVDLDAGEAIVFTYGQPVELNDLAVGANPLVKKTKANYHMRDFTERGNDAHLGLPAANSQPASLVDVLHRLLWLMENEPRSIVRFLDEAKPDRERLRLVAQALAGPGLKGKTEDEAHALIATTASEQAALGKLLANWRALVESQAVPLFSQKGI